MSKSMNMLRTRRRDHNVKPNRRDSKFNNRLDRKSSRGMLYENEELRLKTININAEIERGQSDIKKLKRENEMLKKEIWCLRDEYDKLDKLLKEKKIDFSSSSTTNTSSTSDSETCSSSEESEVVESAQNLKNVQKTNLKNIRDQFDHLSVVTEETSCENSDRNSTRHSLPNDNNENLLWNYDDKDIIKPDQSYPVYENCTRNRSQTLPNQMHGNFFAPIQASKSYDEPQFNQAHDTLYPGQFYENSMPTRSTNISPVGSGISQPQNSNTNFHDYENHEVFTDPNVDSNFLSKKIVRTNAKNFYQNMILVPKSTKPPTEARAMEKKATDLIVKIDNQNFNGKSLTYSNTTPSTTFSNGGNLEELLHDIEAISQDILKLSNLQRGMQNQRGPAFSNDYFQEEPGDLTYAQNPVLDNLIAENLRQQEINDEKTHKSELNVVLMPKAMPLIGFDKYKNVQRSFESLNSKELEDLSASQQNLCIVTPEQQALNDTLTVSASFPSVLMENSSNTEKPEDLNPFFFGNLKDNYVNSDYFNMRYNPDNFPSKPDDSNKTETEKKSISPKTNQLNTPSAEEKSENEENLKFQTSTKPENEKKTEKKIENTPKTPKLSIRRKVSIHFKGKKEKEKLKKQGAEASTTPETKTGSSKATPTESKKHSIFDIKFREKDLKDTKKDNEKQTKGVHQKTPSIESKKSTTETSNLEPKTPTSTESKNSDKKNSVTIENKKDATERGKSRKSASVSPDRSRHVQMKEEGSSRKHKKHKRPDRGGRSRRTSNSDPRHLRERSYSVCTDRSNVLDARLGLGLGLGFGSSYLYDEYSDRERTNSFSSCDTAQSHRKLSTISNVPLNGKLPWCGCWGNGCL